MYRVLGGRGRRSRTALGRGALDRLVPLCRASVCAGGCGTRGPGLGEAVANGFCLGGGGPAS